MFSRPPARFALASLALLLFPVAPASAQESSSDALGEEEIMVLNPFCVETSNAGYRASASPEARMRADTFGSDASSTPAPVAVSLLRRADALAVQFVLSNSQGRQQERNQELYDSLLAVRKAVESIPGARLQQREVRLTSGNRKLISLRSGESPVSSFSLVALLDLPVGTQIADRVKQVRDALGAVQLRGATRFADGAVGLYLRNPNQYRGEILKRIFEDLDTVRKGIGPEFEVRPSGLSRNVQVRVAAEGELELWIDYAFTIHSIRAIEAEGRKD